MQTWFPHDVVAWIGTISVLLIPLIGVQSGIYWSQRNIADGRTDGPLGRSRETRYSAGYKSHRPQIAINVMLFVLLLLLHKLRKVNFKVSYSLMRILMITKSHMRTAGWKKYAACMRMIGNCYRTLVLKPQGKTTLYYYYGCMPFVGPWCVYEYIDLHYYNDTKQEWPEHFLCVTFIWMQRRFFYDLLTFVEANKLRRKSDGPF